MEHEENVPMMTPEEDQAFLDSWLDYIDTPQAIAEELQTKVIGQQEAAECAALVIYKRRELKIATTSLFIGPSGCGKSETWRAAQKMFDSIFMFDVSACTGSGWRGPDIGSYLRTVPESSLRSGRCIVVLDEFDKLCQPALGGNGDTDYNALLQGQILSLVERRDYIIPSGDGMDYDPLVIPGGAISLVLLGAFDSITAGKSRRHAGFGSELEPPRDESITVADLIKYGMRRELAGRIGKIVQLNTPSVSDLMQIGRLYLNELKGQLGKRIVCSDEALERLASAAYNDGLGARGLKNRIDAAIDRQIFINPKAIFYKLG